MLPWAALFLIIVAISALLAYQSMKDYEQKPSLKDTYSLFLIKNPLGVVKVLDSLHLSLLQKSQLVSFERLFKGSQSALVIYGPKATLQIFNNDLNLLELEEYTQADASLITAWEMGTKDLASFHLEKFNIFEGLPSLQDAEQWWWQLVLQPTTSSLDLNLRKKRSFDLKLQKIFSAHPELRQVADRKSQQKTYNAQIRTVLVSSDSKRREDLTAQLTNLANGKLVKIPKPFTSEQILDSYRQRSKSAGLALIISTEEILNLTGIT